MASLEIFEQAGGVEKLREKSLLLTAYLEYLLQTEIGNKNKQTQKRICFLFLGCAGSPFLTFDLTIGGTSKKQKQGEQATILTPTNPNERGCQLSVKFKVDVTQLNDKLGANGVIADVRKPHVIRYLILSHTRRMGNLFFLDLRRCPSITPLTRYIALLASLGTP
mgnify:CR=1 FL=1